MIPTLGASQPPVYAVPGRMLGVMPRIGPARRAVRELVGGLSKQVCLCFCCLVFGLGGWLLLLLLLFALSGREDGNAISGNPACD